MLTTVKTYNNLYSIRNNVNINKKLKFFEDIFKDSQWRVNNEIKYFQNDINAYGKNLFIDTHDIAFNDFNTTLYYPDNKLKSTEDIGTLSLNKSSFLSNKELNNVVIFNKTNNWTIKFYHFVFDVLLKLDLILDKFRDKTILISLDYPAKLKEILIQILESNNLNYIEALDGVKYICKDSIAINAPTGLYARVTREQIDFLNNIITPVKTNKKFKKIFIARKSAKDPFSGFPQRSILNENVLFNKLTKANIDIIYPEDYSINEFSYLMKNAETVISSHGSQLTNIAFCNENTNIIEIMPENYFSKSIACFRAISNIIDLNYKYILGLTPEKFLYNGPRFLGNKEIPCSNMYLTKKEINCIID